MGSAIAYLFGRNDTAATVEDQMRRLGQVRGEMPYEEAVSHLERNSVVVGAGGFDKLLKWAPWCFSSGSLESDLRKVAAVYSKVSAEKGQMRTLRPLQLAAIALYLQSPQQGHRVLAEMKTGEGKTVVVAAIASVLATRKKYAAVHIMTASAVQAMGDLMFTAAFITEFTGQPPLLAADAQGQPGEDSQPARVVVYCEINNIKKLLVQAVLSSTLENLLEYLRKCFCLVGGADISMESVGQLNLSTSFVEAFIALQMQGGGLYASPM